MLRRSKNSDYHSNQGFMWGDDDFENAYNFITVLYDFLYILVSFLNEIDRILNNEMLQVSVYRCRA